jgi:hypothetical protein
VLITVTIAGKSLLMNRFSEEAEIAVQSGTRPANRSGKKGTPREQAERAAYKNVKTGELYVPSQWLLSAMTEAGRFHKMGKRQISTRDESIVPAGIEFDELVISLGTNQFEVDSRRVVIPATGGAIMAHRPRIDDWKLTFTMVVDETVFDADTVRLLLDDAGQKIGIGAYRPACRGPFGRFKITSWGVETDAQISAA